MTSAAAGGGIAGVTTGGAAGGTGNKEGTVPGSWQVDAAGAAIAVTSGAGPKGFTGHGARVSNSDSK
jgi:hypothetical protein